MVNLKAKLSRCAHCPFLYEDEYCLASQQYLEDMETLHCNSIIE